MVFLKTRLRSLDNTGCRIARCIKAYGGSSKKKANLGELVLISIKKFKHRKKLSKKTMYFGWIVQKAGYNKRLCGSFIRFDKTKILIFSDQYKFLGTRVYGPICRELKTETNKIRFKSVFNYVRSVV